ncbi:MAG: hypothetical protein ACRKFN_15775 [Desulfitobacterium sp.]
MLFGRNSVLYSNVLALFDGFPVGTRLQIDMQEGYWIGCLTSIQNNLVIIDNAQIFSDSGSPLEELHSTAQVPLNLITFVSVAPEDIQTELHNDETSNNSATGYFNNFLVRISEMRISLDKSANRFAESLERINNSAQSFVNEVFGVEK